MGTSSRGGSGVSTWASDDFGATPSLFNFSSCLLALEMNLRMSSKILSCCPEIRVLIDGNQMYIQQCELAYSICYGQQIE